MPVEWLDPILAPVFTGEPIQAEIIGSSSLLGEIDIFIRVRDPAGFSIVFVATISAAYRPR